MAEITVDTLVTELEYKADLKTLAKAETAVKDLEVQNKAAATATDVLTQAQSDLGEEIARETKRLNRLKDQHADLKREIRLSGRATKTQRLQLLRLEKQITGTSRRTRELRTEQAQLSRQKARVSRGSRKLAQDQRKLSSAMRQATQRMDEQKRAAGELRAAQAKNIDRAKSAAFAAGAIVAGAVAGLAGATKKVVEVGASFESLRARLKTVEGSADGANQAFARIQQFAARTPFQVENLTAAFTQLRVRGVQPSTETLTALGDLASAFGQDFLEVTDAIGAAARGELDPIEKFGISAKIAGDQISLSFKGQTVEVERSAQAVTDALVQFGKMEGVQGAMAEQSKTLAGQFSNLQDSFAAFLDLIANLGVLDEVKLLTAELGETMQDDLARVIADVLVGALQILRSIIVTIKGDGDGVTTTFSSLLSILELLANIVKAVFIAFFPFSIFFKELAPLLLRVFNLLGMVARAINMLVDVALNLVSALLQPIKDLFNLMVEFAQLLGVWVDEWLGVSETWKAVKDVGDGILGTITSVTNALRGQADATNEVRDALRDLAKEEEIRDRKQRAREGLEATAQGAQGGRVSETRLAKTAERAEEVAKRFDKLSDAQLAAFASDPNIPEKLRDKAEKEQTRRDKRKDKASQSAAEKARKGLVTVEVAEQISKAAEEAGKRAAARALLRGEKDKAVVNRIQREREREVETRLTERFETTGELPPGLATDLTQIANLPNIEAATGKLAPPVITVNNFKTDVTVEAIQANVTVEGGINGTPQQVANASASAVRAVTMQDLGRALQNSLTNLR